jgi:hypothetical protein
MFLAAHVQLYHAFFLCTARLHSIVSPLYSPHHTVSSAEIKMRCSQRREFFKRLNVAPFLNSLIINRKGFNGLCLLSRDMSIGFAGRAWSSRIRQELRPAQPGKDHILFPASLIIDRLYQQKRQRRLRL